MGKDNMFIGQHIFSQLLNMIPFDKVEKQAIIHKSDRYVKRFTTSQHLITMLYGVMSGCNSLREVCSGIVSFGQKISHCKLDYTIPRSALSDANKKKYT